MDKYAIPGVYITKYSEKSFIIVAESWHDIITIARWGCDNWTTKTEEDLRLSEVFYLSRLIAYKASKAIGKFLEETGFFSNDGNPFKRDSFWSRNGNNGYTIYLADFIKENLSYAKKLREKIDTLDCNSANFTNFNSILKDLIFSDFTKGKLCFMMDKLEERKG